MATPTGFDFSQLSYDQKVAALAQLEGEIALELLDKEPPLSPQMIAELERRSAEVHAGTASVSPWEEVRARLMRNR
jgi:putative addiction module component (TIGR02574 family)